MADLYLSSDDFLTGLTFGGRVFGTAGQESVTYASTATGIVVDQNVDRVGFVEDSSAFTFQQQGNQLVVFRGTNEAARIALQGDANGTAIAFSRGIYEAKVSSAGMTLGGITVSADAPKAIDLPPQVIVEPPLPMIVLTTGSDKLFGTGGPDVFTAPPVATSEALTSTFSAGDDLDGGAGVDVLNIITTGKANQTFPATALIRNIEVVQIDNREQAAALTDLAKYPEIEQFWQRGVATDVTNVPDNVLVGFNGVDFRNAGTLSIRAVDAAKTLTIALEENNSSVPNVGVLTIRNDTANGKLDTLTVTGKAATGSNAAQLELSIQAGRDVETVTVSSSVNIKLAVVESPGSTTHLHTIDGSGSTGALTFDLNGLKASSTITAFDGGKIMLGSGADLLSAPTTGVTVAGLQKGAGEDATKAGSADTIVLTGAVQASDATDATFAVKDGLLSFTGGVPASLADALAVARTAATADNATLVFQYLGDSYVFGERSNATASDDVLIKLQGTTSLAGLDTYAANSVYLF